MEADTYLFRSYRLGFRNWLEKDLPALHKINSDPVVMKFFPALLTMDQSQDFINRMNSMYEREKYCYFAVDVLESGELAGFIGLANQNYKSPYTPCVDIGWRLNSRYWGKGMATEAAFKCLEYGFEDVGLKEIRSIAPTLNKASISVMEKIGMELAGVFSHPKLIDTPRLKHCVCYQLTVEKFREQKAD